ncbi:hypothetical protein M0805_003974 [Coniferiporia weirii]|nr:hypothetical protein M0805_003974 [Coniferiporia weirii]
MDMVQHAPFVQGIPSPDAHFSPQQQQQPSQQQQQQQSPSQSQSQAQSAQTQASNQQQQAQQQPQSQPQSQQQSQVPGQQQPQWPNAPHLLQPVTGSPFHSPSTSSPNLVDQSYPAFFHGQQVNDGRLERSGSLSLNISSLTVTSPTNLSPITPSPHPSTASTTLSPITPLSPSTANTTPQQHAFSAPGHRHPQSQGHHHGHHGHHTHGPIPSMFAYGPPEPGVRYEHSAGPFEIALHRSTASSRSSSSSGKSIPRKRSFTGSTAHLPMAVEENVYESNAGDVSASLELTPASFEEVDMGYPSLESQGSPVDGSSSGGEHEDPFKALGHHLSAGHNADMAQSGGIIGKPSGTNNFVSKLYQMISDPKSSHFIQWTELGTSFVVSNVGEFSRTILGSHFKHNNFSSFVRQLNMYGFHKINRTPRAQRTSTDAQTWEFSHPKFLRGRPDLLDEIKRKALEPDPTIKHRVELPGEVAAQLNQMRDQNRRVIRALEAERAKVDRLTSVTKTLHEVISKAFPGSGKQTGRYLHAAHGGASLRSFFLCRRTFSFPPELWEASDNPPIFITSPASRYPSAMALPNAFHNLQSFSPTSSPTAADFPPHHGHAPTHPHSHPNLSRTHSLQHIPYDTGYPHGVPPTRYDTGAEGAMELDASSSDRKRQRTGSTLSAVGLGPSDGSSKRLSRARSDSAPLGYANANGNGVNTGGLGTQAQPWPHGHGHAPGVSGSRPRSGSGLAPRGVGRREDLLINISGTANRGTPSATSPLVNVSPKAVGP